jgi:hypothetical protein
MFYGREPGSEPEARLTHAPSCRAVPWSSHRRPLAACICIQFHAHGTSKFSMDGFACIFARAGRKVFRGRFGSVFFLFRCPLQSLGKGMHRCHLKLDKIPRAWIRQQQARSIMHRVHASCGGVRTLCIFPTRSLLIARRASRGKQTCAPRTVSVSIVPLGLLRLYTNVTAPLPHACTALCCLPLATRSRP